MPIDVAPAEMLCSARMHTPSFASSRGALHSSSGLDIAMDGSQSQSSSTSIFFSSVTLLAFLFPPSYSSAYITPAPRGLAARSNGRDSSTQLLLESTI